MVAQRQNDMLIEERGEGFSKRQREVLDAALKLLVAGEDRLSMSAIARAASCSKETLYNWFGDSDGVLAAIVRRQASKVRMPEETGEGLDLGEIRARLTVFADDLLTVLAGDMSVALNRLAVGHAGSRKFNTGSHRSGKRTICNGTQTKAADCGGTKCRSAFERNRCRDPIPDIFRTGRSRCSDQIVARGRSPQWTGR